MKLTRRFLWSRYESKDSMDSNKRHAPLLFIALLMGFSCAPLLHADQRNIDPTFLYRTFTVGEKKSDLTTTSCHYKPLFGHRDSDISAVVGVARYGEAVIDPNGACATVQYSGEDQVYVVLEGNGSVKYGSEMVSLDKEDYLYLPATIPYSLLTGPGRC
jgi:mannose-6-phosphate isomerase-like protein (cupin superfamily)